MQSRVMLLTFLVVLGGLSDNRIFAAEIQQPLSDAQIIIPSQVECSASGCQSGRAYVFVIQYQIPGTSGTQEEHWIQLGSGAASPVNGTASTTINITANLAASGNPYTGRVRLYELTQTGQTLIDVQQIQIIGTGPN